MAAGLFAGALADTRSFAFKVGFDFLSLVLGVASGISWIGAGRRCRGINSNTAARTTSEIGRFIDQGRRVGEDGCAGTFAAPRRKVAESVNINPFIVTWAVWPSLLGVSVQA